MIRQAVKTDEESLKSLWKTTFGDEEKNISLFFELKKDNPIYVYETDGITVSMLCMIFSEKAAYLYALATEEKYRNRGYMSELIKYAVQRAEEKNKDYLFLIPAEPELSDYYKRHGFTEKTWTHSYKFHHDYKYLCRSDMEEVITLTSVNYECTNNLLKFGNNMIRYVLSEEECEYYVIRHGKRCAGYIVVCEDYVKYYGMEKADYGMLIKAHRNYPVVIKKLKSLPADGIEGFIPF